MSLQRAPSGLQTALGQALRGSGLQVKGIARAEGGRCTCRRIMGFATVLEMEDNKDKEYCLNMS